MVTIVRYQIDCLHHIGCGVRRQYNVYGARDSGALSARCAAAELEAFRGIMAVPAHHTNGVLAQTASMPPLATVEPASDGERCVK
jgi:hypothetical protein